MLVYLLKYYHKVYFKVSIRTKVTHCSESPANHTTAIGAASNPLRKHLANLKKR